MENLSASHYGSHRHVLDFDSLEDVPECRADDILIRVVYAELNPVDLQKLGSKNGQAVTNGPLVVGFGGSGIVQDVGSNIAKDWKDKRVAFLCDPSRPGSYATHVLVDQRLVAPVPFQLTLKEAATVPLAGCTAYESLLKLGLGNDMPLRGSDPTLLVVGGAGGVGSWTIQLARALYPNLKIIATATSEPSGLWCQRMGANQVIKHDEIALQLQGGRRGSVDYILCLAEPTLALFGALSEVIRPYGSICLAVAGESIKSLDLSFVFFKAATITTQTVFSSIRTNFEYIQPAVEIEDLLQHVAARSAIIAPLSPQLGTLAGAEDWKLCLQEDGILDKLASGHAIGKLVMKIGSEE
jgi:NADPH:quinone reductase-like Zn-dependent oxidoreductase